MTVLRVIDIETTGMEPPAEIVEIGWQDVRIEAGEASLVDGPRSQLFQAERGIPPETRAVHHISEAMTAGEPFCTPDVMRLHCASGGPVLLVAHNAAFEAAFLNEAVQTTWLCTYKAALRVWPDAPSHSNSVLRYWLEDQGLLSLDHETAMPPHRAGPDAYVTAHILKALLAAGATGRDMVAWTQEPRLLPTCPIGKFRGQKWADVEAGFLNWMLAQASMEEDLKWNARREIERRRG